MIELMATSKPGIGNALGSVPEVLVYSKTAFVCHSLEKMIEAIPAVTKIDRQTCRNHVLNRFSIQIMTNECKKTAQMLLA